MPGSTQWCWAMQGVACNGISAGDSLLGPSGSSCPSCRSYLDGREGLSAEDFSSQVPLARAGRLWSAQHADRLTRRQVKAGRALSTQTLPKVFTLPQDS